MLTQLRSELIKLTTVRTTWVFVLATAGFVGMMVAIQAATSGSELMAPLTDGGTQRALFLSGTAAPIVAIVFGCLGITSELRHHTIVSTLLFDASRVRVVLAKTLATAVAGTGLGVVAVVVATAASAAALLATGTAFAVEAGPLLAAGAGTVGASALGAVLGLGIGGVVRNQALAVGTVLVLLLAVEPLVGSLLPASAPWLPSSLVAALAEAQPVGEVALWTTAAVLASYAALATIGAVLTLRRSDIT